jgi:hypothetical protein
MHIYGYSEITVQATYILETAGPMMILFGPSLPEATSITNIEAVLTEVDEESTVTLTLIGGQRKDAGHIVVQERVLLLKQKHTK